MVCQWKKKLFASCAILSVVSSIVIPTIPIVQAEDDDVILDFPSEVHHEGEAIEGGTLRYALVQDTEIKGILNNMFNGGESDGKIVELFNPGLYGYNENYEIDDSGFADIEVDFENKQVKITIPEGHTWHDGEPITIDDVIIPYKVIGHPDYDGIKYSEDLKNVVGMEEYHNGEADDISGLERVDDHTLLVHYKEMNVSMKLAGGAILNLIEPSHIFKDIPVAEMFDSEYIRSTPIGFGPFKVDSYTHGEAVTFSAFDDYYEGRPKIDHIVLEVVGTSTIIQELKAGNYDIADLPADQFETYKDAENFTTLGVLSGTYSYIGFKFGHWDDELGENVQDEDTVVRHKALRVAMQHAIDNNQIGSRFYHGLRQNANSLITPNFVGTYNPDNPYYEYDPEEAMRILDEAGFVDVDGDGMREDPDGNKFTLNFATMAAGEVAEPIATYYIQSWRDIGIDIQLLDGRLHDVNAFYDRVDKDDPEIQVFQAAWSTGGDPNPYELYGKNAKFNYVRYADEENERLLANLTSKEAFDEEYRKQAYYEWQKYMAEEVPCIPTLYRYNLVAVNNRVSDWNINTGNKLNWNEIYLTAEEPVK